jgi:hypothetical protein
MDPDRLFWEAWLAQHTPNVAARIRRLNPPEGPAPGRMIRGSYVRPLSWRKAKRRIQCQLKTWAGMDLLGVTTPDRLAWPLPCFTLKGGKKNYHQLFQGPITAQRLKEWGLA